MPYFTRQVAPNGTLILNANIGVSEAREHALKQSGGSVPNRVKVQALLDTGCTGLCIDGSVFSQLGLSPTGSAQIVTPTTGSTPATVDQYDVSLAIFTTTLEAPLSYDTIAATESDLLAAQGFHVLLGLSVLKDCMLSYDGKNGLFSLAY